MLIETGTGASAGWSDAAYVEKGGKPAAEDLALLGEVVHAGVREALGLAAPVTE